LEIFTQHLNAGVIWLILGTILLILEIFVPGLILFFFGIGACLTGVLCFIMPLSINTQLVIFLISSLLLLFLLRNYFINLFKGFSKETEDESKNTDNVIGKKVKVIKEINKDNPGLVEMNGVNWNAESEQTLEQGQWCVIVKRENLTLYVKEITKEE